MPERYGSLWESSVILPRLMPVTRIRRFSLGFQHLLDLGNAADSIQVFQRRVVHQQILLGNQQQILVALHGRFQRLNGLTAADFKMNGLFGENAQSPQGKDGHFPCKNGFSQSSSLLFEKRG